jgi:hypothetical protein
VESIGCSVYHKEYIAESEKMVAQGVWDLGYLSEHIAVCWQVFAAFPRPLRSDFNLRKGMD